MEPKELSNVKKQTRGPKWAWILAKPIAGLDRIFDFFYSSKYNPLYRSGVLATLLLSIVTVTGLYLLIFYRLSAPYESLQNIQEQVWAGRWIRTLHRYASDAAVLAVVIHFLRMMAEGKTWGPRFLAWVSGVALFGMMFVSAWTGFVLMWDRHGQIVAEAGARLIDTLGLLPDPLIRSFNGSVLLGSSFFFMNLFLHVAVPLGMTIGLWIHLARLARPKWFPEKKPLLMITGVLFLLSVIWPAPLERKADLFEIGGTYIADFWFNFWLPLDFNPRLNAMLWISGFLFLFSIPFWWRPRKADEPNRSQHDQEKCEGCTQCVQDCPFDAIEMVPRKVGTGSAEVAEVLSQLCVGCGLCSGSCSQFAIGPTGRAGRDQIAVAKTLHPDDPEAVALILCSNNPSYIKLQNALIRRWPKLFPIYLECIGNLHPGTLTLLMQKFRGAVILGCPPELCQFREGNALAEARIFQSRNPGPPARVELSKILTLEGTIGDLSEISSQIANAFPQFGKESTKSSSVGSSKPLRLLKAGALTTTLLGLIGTGSSVQLGQPEEAAHLRLSWRLSGQVHEECRERSAEEISKLPLHMRTPKVCTKTPIDYQLRVLLDGQIWAEEIIQAKGARGDRPLVVFVQRQAPIGAHHLEVQFGPQMEISENTSLKRLNKTFEVNFQKGRAILVTYEPSEGELSLRQ